MNELLIYLFFVVSGYMAPECFCGSSISVKSDVFSFGVLILEIISGRKVATSFRRYKRSVNLMAYVTNLSFSCM